MVFSTAVALGGFGFSGLRRWQWIRDLKNCAKEVVGGEWHSIQQKVHKLTLIAFPLKTEEKTPVLSQLFGFLASLAITYGLLKYYDNFITPIVIPAASSVESLFPLLDLSSLNILPTLHLIDFFIVAIPLTHSGYLFLSSLVIHYIKTKDPESGGKEIINYIKNPAFGLVLIFIFSIVQASFLFFLANSTATKDISVNSTVIDEGKAW